MGKNKFGATEMMLSQESFDAVMKKVKEAKKQGYKEPSTKQINNNEDSFNDLVKGVTKQFHQFFTRKK